MPTLPHHKDTVRLLPGGAGKSSQQVNFKREADSSTITTITTDSNGKFEKSLATTVTTGQSSYEIMPGPYFTEAVDGAYARYHSSASYGTAGALNLMAQLFLNRAMGTGLISSPGYGLNTGAVTSAGAARTVVVATFAAVIEGIPVWNDAARTINISANASGNPRIDTIVIEMVPAGQATEGKCTLKVVEGTTSQPTLTQSTTLWQFPLANVTVANGASVITQGNITDRRDYVERAVTEVEDDLVALEERVEDLEGYRVPREEIVATYSAALDPASVAAFTWAVVLAVVPGALTYHNGYSSTSMLTPTGMRLVASHRAAETAGLHVSTQISSTGSPQVTFVNPSGVAVNAGSDTLTLVVYKLVTA